MNVNEIYKVNKFVVCLQCRKDKEILDVLKQLATVRSAKMYVRVYPNTGPVMYGAYNIRHAYIVM